MINVISAIVLGIASLIFAGCGGGAVSTSAAPTQQPAAVAQIPFGTYSGALSSPEGTVLSLALNVTNSMIGAGPDLLGALSSQDSSGRQLVAIRGQANGSAVNATYLSPDAETLYIDGTLTPQQDGAVKVNLSIGGPDAAKEFSGTLDPVALGSSNTGIYVAASRAAFDQTFWGTAPYDAIQINENTQDAVSAAVSTNLETYFTPGSFTLYLPSSEGTRIRALYRLDDMGGALWVDTWAKVGN